MKTVFNTPSTTSEGAVELLWQRNCLLWFRGIALVFSFISVILVATNKHGDLEEFNLYDEYRYLLAIAIVSCLYTGHIVYRQFNELCTTGISLLPPRSSSFITFCFVGDQIMAYLMISSTSSAVPLTIKMMKAIDSYNVFTDSAAAAISMSFFAFLSLALSALVSGYQLSTQVYA